MYIRFTTPGEVTRAGIAPGLFRAAYPLARQHGHEPLGQALWWEIDWFERNLPVPRGRQPFAVRSKKRWHKDGVCWFRGEAREMLTHAHVMAALIEDCGVPVTRRLAEHPGQILYRDAWQVVAKPDIDRRRCAWSDPRAPAPLRFPNLRRGGRHAKPRSHVRHAPVLSSGPPSGVRAIPARRASSAGCARSRAVRWNCSRNWGATIGALAVRGRGFKACCLKTGRFDGAERRDYWR